MEEAAREGKGKKLTEKEKGKESNADIMG